MYVVDFFFFFFSSRRRHTRCLSDWSSDVCSSDLVCKLRPPLRSPLHGRIAIDGAVRPSLRSLNRISQRPTGVRALHLERVIALTNMHHEVLPAPHPQLDGVEQAIRL